jgi:dTDP-4-dehydrorhamnose 3,5-epimerase
MITKTNIKDLLIIDILKFSDERGCLIKPFSKTFFNDFTDLINTDFKETWFTKSHKDVIRAMHLQVGPLACEKLVSVVNGAVLDVILDLRIGSSSYGEVFEIELNENNKKALYVPAGCAHGYKVLKDNTITMYMATQVHDAENDVGICWNSFGYDWKVDSPILAQKDLELPEFKIGVELW